MKQKIKKLNKEIKRLRRLLLEHEHKIKQLRVLVDYDFLTGIYNRQGFIKETGKFLFEFQKNVKIKREKRKFVIKCLSIIFIDIDDLKKINDFYGHKIGDKFLKNSVEIFRKSLREIDILGRWGGDEFVVGLVNICKEDAYKIAKKLKRNLSKIKLKGVKEKIKFSASFGIISAENKKLIRLSIHNLIELADKAMYRAKKKGKGFIVVYDDKLAESRL